MTLDAYIERLFDEIHEFLSATAFFGDNQFFRHALLQERRAVHREVDAHFGVHGRAGRREIERSGRALGHVNAVRLNVEDFFWLVFHFLYYLLLSAHRKLASRKPSPLKRD